jgi:ParB-like chromosome segregation protein Spo0J
MATADQPVSTVRWLPRDALRANTWNPNHAAPTEMDLLELSIVENGWTQPIVARVDGEIVDGYHRWRVAERPKVSALTDGLVPVVTITAGADEVTTRMATIRHNRARGAHHVIRLADLVNELAGMGVEDDEIGRRLGMDHEEVRRFLERGRMAIRGARPVESYSGSWHSEK